MRRASIAAAALALAACSVDVEGARCTTPGTAAECPDGQACGADGKCSVRAAGCPAPNCFVGTLRCGGGTAGTDDVEACVAGSDPVCGSWQASDHCAQKSLLCATRTGAGSACECLPNAGTEFAVDPATSQPGLRPTGLAAPPGCRYAKLGEALAAAAAHAGAATAQVYGAAGATVSFGTATGESYPLVVAANVTLVGAAGVQETVIKGEAASAANILTVAGAVHGLTVANVNMTGTGVDLACPPAGMPALQDVLVTAGTTKLATGVSALGGCGAVLQRVDVSGASGAALEVAASSTTAAVTVSGSSLHGSGTGLHVVGARVVLQNDGAKVTAVTGNAGSGIAIDGASAVDVTVSGATVALNGATGLVLGNVPTTSKLVLAGCDFRSNASVAATPYGPGPSRRTAGGILLSPQGLLGTFQMQQNMLHSNDGGVGADELAFETGTGWVVSTGACATANAIGCIGTGSSISVVSPGTVNAQFTTWPGAATMTYGFVDTANACSPAWSFGCP